MEARKSQSYRWWFDSHNSPNRSHWLLSSLSELDERMKAMLTIIEEDADSFTQRAEMYYKKRPQLVSMVEDFYRAHRSLAEQFDRLRHDPSARRTSPLACSLSLLRTQQTPVLDQHRSYDVCFTKLAFDSEDAHPSPSISKGQSEQVMDPLKSLDRSFTELGYGSGEESGESEVDDPVHEVIRSGEEEDEEVKFGEGILSRERNGEEVKRVLRGEIERLLEENAVQKNQLAQRDRVIDELKRKISENTDELVKMRKEIDRLRVENAENYLLRRKEDDDERETSKQQLCGELDEVEKLREEIELLREMTKKIEAQVAKLNEQAGRLRAEKATLIKLRDSELNGLREEIQRIRSENLAQMELLEQKDEEKREVIRQLTVAIEMLKDENRILKNSGPKDNLTKRRKNPLDLQGLKGLAKLFNWSPISQASIVPL